MILVTPRDDLQAVFDRARSGEEIRLTEGEYRQKVTIFTPGLRIRGAGAGQTKIVWNDYAKKLDDKGVEYNTFRTWTVAVCAEGVAMV